MVRNLVFPICWCIDKNTISPLSLKILKQHPQFEQVSNIQFVRNSSTEETLEAYQYSVDLSTSTPLSGAITVGYQNFYYFSRNYENFWPANTSDIYCFGSYLGNFKILQSILPPTSTSANRCFYYLSCYCHCCLLLLKLR